MAKKKDALAFEKQVELVAGQALDIADGLISLFVRREMGSALIGTAASIIVQRFVWAYGKSDGASAAERFANAVNKQMQEQIKKLKAEQRKRCNARP